MNKYNCINNYGLTVFPFNDVGTAFMSSDQDVYTYTQRPSYLQEVST